MSYYFWLGREADEQPDTKELILHRLESIKSNQDVTWR